tara:strand:+ start:195 stop:662 length:468 start_codon:yes stop_codon:yes gene_type:complete
MKKLIILLFLPILLTLPHTPKQASAQSQRVIRTQIIDQYAEDIKNAKATGKTTVVMVTESWCGPCGQLKSKLSRVQGIIVSKIGLKHAQVSKLNTYYKSKGLKTISGIPDWVVIKYKDGKLVHFSRYLGDCSTQTLMSRLNQANTPNINIAKKAK